MYQYNKNKLCQSDSHSSRNIKKQSRYILNTPREYNNSRKWKHYFMWDVKGECCWPVKTDGIEMNVRKVIIRTSIDFCQILNKLWHMICVWQPFRANYTQLTWKAVVWHLRSFVWRYSTLNRKSFIIVCETCLHNNTQ